jgi:hypothetical protein
MTYEERTYNRLLNEIENEMGNIISLAEQAGKLLHENPDLVSESDTIRIQTAMMEFFNAYMTGNREDSYYTDQLMK